ncbi:MAG TPA: hypothetical protein DHD79_00465 [Firmicutes bacterium]|jgi:DNA-binding transcriptional ArsR family regulator|nr:hypothetical protein [Bacillota bacterium]HBL48920.1 hypothetical protein [Bacillota bacterium]HBR24702.1 hypothetical protein [Bacillota bacterium]HCM18999.1 hypothetical protein [Bacillota bacterium]HCX69696.1 hypothetical protein [Bacillota bacterium]
MIDETLTIGGVQKVRKKKPDDGLLEEFIISEPEQFKALSDRKRLSILSILVEKQATVSQLAEEIGDIPANVHHHVKLLERAGLIQLVETREKSGILEKYYRAVAGRLTVEHDVGVYTDSSALVLDTVAAAVKKGIRIAVAGNGAEVFGTVEELFLNTDQLADFKERLSALLAEYAEQTQAPECKRYWLAMAFYPDIVQ